MNEPKKWGYIYDEKLNMYVPNLPRQKKFEKVLLFLSIISFVALLILNKSSYEKISFLTYTSVMVFLFLALYLVLKINIRMVEKRLEEVKELKLSKELEIKALKNRRFFAYMMLWILLIVMFVFRPHMIKTKYIFYLIFAIPLSIYNFYILFKELKNNKHSLTIFEKTIKIYYENNEKEVITTDNISYVRFYAIVLGRGKDKNPTLQIFDSEEKILVEMTIKPIDYYSLKKYFEKYNVRIDNQYREF